MGRGLAPCFAGLGVLATGVGVLAFSGITSSCFGLGVRTFSAGAGSVFCMLCVIAFVFIVFVLRGGFVMSHVPTNSPQGLLDERGIPGKIWPRSLLIGWVKPSRVDGLWLKEKK